MQKTMRSDAEAWALVLKNQGLISLWIRKMRVRPHQIDDAWQEARVGLFVAARTFDPERGKFSTHAGWWIYDSISKFLRRERGEDCMVGRYKDGIGTPRHREVPKRMRVTIGSDMVIDPIDSISTEDESDPIIRLRTAAALREMHPRWQEMLREHLRGEDLRTIGRQHNISRERVRQILNNVTGMLAAAIKGRPVTRLHTDETIDRFVANRGQRRTGS